MYDVAIIGCGPVGALAANLLGREGLKILALERENDPFPLPRAVHLDHEMMRLFQAAGVIDRLAPAMRDTEGHLHIGADHGVIRYMGTVGRPRPFGWSNDYFFYQPELEAELRSALGAYPNVELRLGTELIGLEQKPDHVRLQLASGDERSEAKARWVIASDGARSTVRKCLGIRLDDLEFEEPWLVVDAEVDAPLHFPDLSGVPAGADLQKLSVMMCDPERPATIVPGRGNHRRWEFMLLPGEDDGDMMKPEKVAELVAPWLKGVGHRIIRAATYRFHGLVAERWKAGGIFLAGDAAHQTPPFFGQGMCHGMRDVANLAWKMAMVARGAASEDLLDTYQRERDPHVRAVIAAAVEAGRYICVLDPEAARRRDLEMRAAAARQTAHSTAGDLIPPIMDGVVAGEAMGPAERFIQPYVATPDGRRLLDDVVGNGWRLFAADAAAAREAQGLVEAGFSGVNIAVVDVSKLDDDGAIGAWLASRDARTVLVRPDFYVFGRSDDVGALLASLAHHLHRPAAIAEVAA